MSDPKLKCTSVVIKYTADDGYKSELMCKGGDGTTALVPPEKALLAGLEELARLTALFGFEDQALEVFTEARSRVAEWKSQRTEGDAA